VARTELLLLLLDRQRALKHVDVPLLEAEKLTEPQANETGEHDEAAIAAGHCIGE
jgi:hypothetical protein